MRVRVVLLVGAAYLIIGLGFAELASRFGVGWRLAAWAVSAVLFAAHIGYEQIRLRSSLTVTAGCAALAAALGAFGLAVAATIHAVQVSSFRPAFVIALIAWPVMTGLAAFVVAFAAAALLSRLRREAHR